MIYLGLAFYAKGQLDEYRRVRQDASRPYVVVDFSLTEPMFLVISNIGSSPARNVTFRFSEPLTSTDPNASVLRSRALNEGLPMLPPGKVYEFYWDLAAKRFVSGLPLTYSVEVGYDDGHGNHYTDEYVLDLAKLSDAAIVKTEAERVAKAIRELRQELHRWTDGTSGLLVHGRDKDAMIARARERSEERRSPGRGVHAPPPADRKD